MVRKFLKRLPPQFILPLFIFGGVIAGLGIYTLYISRAHTYVSDEPATCVNCHIMTPYFHSWNHSSHARWTNCNDCHVPQDNVVKKYAFKAIDGLYHSAVFTVKKEPQVIRPRDASNEVIMKNCIRCHTQLNTEFVKTGMTTYAEVKENRRKACWDCHMSVPHTKISNLASSPNAIAPLPQSADVMKPPPAGNVPDWLSDMLKK